MKKILFASILLSLFCCFTFAQNGGDKAKSIGRTKDASCPKIKITNPPAKFKAGETATYKIKLTGDFDKEKVGFIWEVENKGAIARRRSSTLQIATRKDAPVTSTKVKLFIYGLDSLCDSIYVTELGKSLALPKPYLFDEFSRMVTGDVRARLDGFLVEVHIKSEVSAYIINYGTDKQIKRRETLFKQHFKYRKYDTSSIYFIHGGRSDKPRTRLWIVPPGADVTIIN